MCEESGGLMGDNWLDVEVSLESGDPSETYGYSQGNWDIIASFGIGDEVVLEQAMELPIAKVMILDYYAPLYAKKARLLIRKRQRKHVPKPNLIEYHHEISE
jgi:hypothetical protein